MQARATNDSAVTRSRARAASTALMSTSIQVVHVAAVSSERFMWAPICRRMRDSSAPAPGSGVPGRRSAPKPQRPPKPERPPRPEQPAAGGTGSGRYGLSMCSGGSSATGVAVPARRVDQGEHVLLAHAPAATGSGHRGEVDPVLGGDPLDHRRVAPRARAVGTRRRSASRGGAVTRRRDGHLRARGRRLGDRAMAAAAPSSVAIRASTVPTSTVASTATMISATTPVTGAGTSVSILSVEISQIVSSASIRSPTVDPPGHDRALGHRDPHLGHRHIDEGASSRGAHGTPP